MTSLARWSLWRRFGSMVLIGAFAALGLAPVGWWAATLLALLAVPAVFLSTETSRHAALIGWAFGFGWFLPALVWIIEPFLVDIATHGWMAPFALALFSGGMALFWGIAFWAAFRLGRSPLTKIAALVLMLSLAEFARAYVLSGLPWAALAQIWVNTSAARLLAWIGPHGLALLTLMVPVGTGYLLANAQGARSRIIAIVPVTVLCICVLGFDYALKGNASPLTDATVRLIQPNAPQHQKWDPDYIPIFFSRSIDFTAAAPPPGQPQPDLIVWPESSIPMYFHAADPAFDVIMDAARGTPVVAGIQRRVGQRLYNSLVYLDEAGEVAAIYDKHHLVPFGEYIPLGNLASRFGWHGLASGEGDGFSAGPGPQVISLGPLGKALPLICYEAVFPQDVGGTTERPDFLLLITNDAWFGNYSGPYQHLAQAQMRSIEQGLPMIRAANTGISAMIDPLGRITRSLPLGEAGFIDARLPAPLPPTIYSKTGDLPLFLMLLAASLGLAGSQLRHKVAT
ncbi:MAG: apolipoprotein N-acyltransferase [Rhodobacteraceae bacterium]|nr:apolipoprotein N-acyltransferase [Paracoccaceae bacterium]